MEGRPGGAWRMQGPAGAPVAGLPIGFRFRPTDEELLLHYLRRKALACPLPAGIIPDADLARLHPWDLLPPGGGGGGGGGDADGERFFFYRPATRCWRKGGGVARAAGTGVWRPSGKEKLVVSPRCKRPVGTKRTLVFCRGRARGAARTDWAMHEYRLLPAGLHPFHGCAAAGSSTATHVSCHGAAADWVVCRIFKRTKPAAHRGREDDDAEEMPSSPSSASSCVTDTSEAGDQEHDDDEGSSSNGGGSSCSVASN
ncbi:NAC domain-containing protein 83-like isoform X2 [Panicum virgatum]|uniref:NAC domain-containing protein 83-like isoform X2 n=1 Tax=Panicum virgatum TaxID=38727 RepID=UPI0019D5407A|nr:NAC domain-containing protein 83-like isoform X2 [Panicum virgatum]